MPEVRIPAFAKINLRLDVLGKREDGFHELRTIFQTISLHDELRLRASRRDGIALSIQGNQPLSAEPVEKNLVYRAVDPLRRGNPAQENDSCGPWAGRGIERRRGRTAGLSAAYEEEIGGGAIDGNCRVAGCGRAVFS